MSLQSANAARQMTQGGTVYLSLAAYYAGTAELTGHPPAPVPRHAPGGAEEVRGLVVCGLLILSGTCAYPLGRGQPMHAGPMRGRMGLPALAAQNADTKFDWLK